MVKERQKKKGEEEKKVEKKIKLKLKINQIKIPSGVLTVSLIRS